MKADMKEIIAKSQIAAMMNLLEDYVIPIIDDIADVLPEPNDTWSDVEEAKGKMKAACSLLEKAYESLPQPEDE